MDEKKCRDYIYHELLFLNLEGLELVLHFIYSLQQIQKKYRGKKNVHFTRV